MVFLGQSEGSQTYFPPIPPWSIFSPPNALQQYIIQADLVCFTFAINDKLI